MGFECVTRTHIGCRRKINEDSLLSRPDLGLWAVADGMGGHDAGEVASALVIERLAFCRPDQALDALTLDMRRAIQDANIRLVAMAETGPVQRTIGSTVVTIAVDEASFVCLWVGDSRAYRVRHGALSQITRDHSLVQELVDIGEIDAAAAGSHPDANVITRAVGAAQALEIDGIDGDILADDVFLLASDGLTRLVADDELLDAMKARDLEEEADRLIELCLARGAPDNISFVMLRPRPA